MTLVEKALHGIDTAHRRHTWIAFPYAVVKKFNEDQAGNLAALIAYFGFFSLFPLLLVLVTVLDMVLPSNGNLRQSIFNSALSNFPLIGPQISKNVHSLRGSGLTLAIGVALTFWAGLGVVKATQTAMNSVWNVPYEKRPNFWKSNSRAVLMLALMGALTLASALSASVGTGSGTWWWVLGIPVSFALNVLLFMLVFRILTAEELSWKDVRPGAIIGGVAWTILQATGGYYVGHQLQGASDTYGTFAIVIGLLAWIYLGAQITLFAAEVNVVKSRHLWPRGFVQPPFTDADVEVLSQYVQQEKRRPEQRVSAEVIERPPGPEKPEVPFEGSE
jgi:YihY family inner membrane protein